MVVPSLGAALAEREELVAHVEEGHAAHSSAELEGEEAAVERERFLEIADLESDVVDAQEPGPAAQLVPPAGLAGSVGRYMPKAAETLL